MVLSSTSVRFIRGVPFDNSYSHTRWFDTRTEQFNYFNSFPNIQRTQNNFQKSTGRFSIDVREDVETMMTYDYMMYRNADYGNKWFYGFILNVEHVSKNVSRVYFEVDPIQTYMFDVDIKSSYVVREHEHGNSDNIYPEGLQMGKDYETLQTWDIKPYPFYFLVIVTKDLIHEGTTLEHSGTFNGVPDPLNYYWYPIPRNTNSNIQFNESVGGDSFHTSFVGVTGILKYLQHSQLAVNNVVSIYVTDYIPVGLTQDTTNEYTMSRSNSIVELKETFVDGEELTYKIIRVGDQLIPTDDFLDFSVDVGNVFSVVGNETQPKLSRYPYTIVELSDGRGNNLVYKPEGLDNGDIRLRILGGLTYHNNVVYGLHDYNNGRSRSQLLDHAIINTDPQDLSILNNQTASYLQGAKNSIQAKRNTWQAQASYQARGAAISAVTSLGNMVGSGIGMGMDALSLGYGVNMMATGVGNIAQSVNDGVQSKVDHQNKIFEQLAMEEDLTNVPPSLQKQGNNPSLNIGYNMQGVRIRVKRVRHQYLDRARDYMHMFGTKTNSLKTPNIRTRTHFNYVKTSMLNVQSSLYNDDVIRFKQIFDQGITIWHTNDIYNYDVSNTVR